MVTEGMAGILQRDHFWDRIKSQIKRINVELPDESDWDVGDRDRGIPATTNKATVTIFYYWRTEPYPEAETWITDLEGTSGPSILTS